MFESFTLRGIRFTPARLCAPMAGATHSAFRRWVAEFGGCGGFMTEMLSGRQILGEDVRRSPALRRNAAEPRLLYQLMLSGADAPLLDRIIGRLAKIEPDGLDINLACDAPPIRQREAGSRLFDDAPALARVLTAARCCWPGLLTVKIRLGRAGAGWEARFVERLRIIEESGVDAVILHPRFFDDRLRRHARHELYAWAASLTRLPLVANGDIGGPADVQRNAGALAPAAGVMIGRMAMVQPWIFAAWDRPLTVDYADAWRRLCAYTCEDFPPSKALGRIKMLTEYFARNFVFGHVFYVAVQTAPTLEVLRERGEAFLGASPALAMSPSPMGL